MNTLYEVLTKMGLRLKISDRIADLRSIRRTETGINKILCDLLIEKWYDQCWHVSIQKNKCVECGKEF